MALSWDTPIKRELHQVEEEIAKSVQSKQRLLTEISTHVIGSGGKRIRPGVSLLAFHAVGGQDNKKVIQFAAALELIHSATLIHDDINDGGQLRRGKPAAHKKYGVQQALVAGDFLFVKGFRLGGLLMAEDIIELVAQTCTEMAESEILQAKHEGDANTSLNSYMNIIEGKTAKPIEASARVGAFLGKGSMKHIAALGQYGLNLGYAFQIVDDILDIEGQESVLGKPKAMDFIDGNMTLPIMLAINNGSGGKRVRELFIKKDKTSEDIEEALQLISRSEALSEARAQAQAYAAKAVKHLEIVPESQYKDSLIELTKVVVERKA